MGWRGVRMLPASPVRCKTQSPGAIDMSSETSPVAIGLGSNLGQREERLREAVVALDELLEGLRFGDLYESAPVGDISQPHFLNTAVVGRSRLTPEPLLALLKFLEQRAGRRRGERRGPRPLDLDLLLHGDTVETSAALTLPHPELRRRPFVLIPLVDAAPDLHLPPDGVAAKALAQEADRNGLVRRGWAQPPLVDPPR